MRGGARVVGCGVVGCGVVGCGLVEGVVVDDDGDEGEGWACGRVVGTADLFDQGLGSQVIVEPDDPGIGVGGADRGVLAGLCQGPHFGIECCFQDCSPFGVEDSPEPGHAVLVPPDRHLGVASLPFLERQPVVGHCPPHHLIEFPTEPVGGQAGGQAGQAGVEGHESGPLGGIGESFQRSGDRVDVLGSGVTVVDRGSQRLEFGGCVTAAQGVAGCALGHVTVTGQDLDCRWGVTGCGVSFRGCGQLVFVGGQHTPAAMQPGHQRRHLVERGRCRIEPLHLLLELGQRGHENKCTHVV